MKKNYYQVLGVAVSSTRQETRDAYRRLAHKYHPDKGNKDSQKFKDIHQAYEVLSDPQKREQYNLNLLNISKSKDVGGNKSEADPQKPQAINSFKYRDVAIHIWKYIETPVLIIIFLICVLVLVLSNEENPPSWVDVISNAILVVIGVIVLAILILIFLYYTKLSPQLNKFVKKNIIGELEEEGCQCDDCVEQGNKK